MPLETAFPDIDTRVATLNRRAGSLTPQQVLALALDDGLVGKVAMVSSFGADSVVLLHMLAQIDPDIPVLFIDTELMFAETLRYQREVAALLGLRDVRVIRAPRAQVFAADPDGLLQHFDPESCCTLRKVAPLRAALTGFDGWITGRKRFQAGTRQDLAFFEPDSDGERIKVNPLARSTAAEITAYIGDHSLPRHPLVARGYASIGCAPCTTPVKQGEDIRAGRWRGREKTECGIHFPAVDGILERVLP